ncbi:Clathrin light chain [Basidiobolus ranarum]
MAEFSQDPTADFLARERELLGDDAGFLTGDSGDMKFDDSSMDKFPPLDNFSAPEDVPLPQSQSQSNYTLDKFPALEGFSKSQGSNNGSSGLDKFPSFDSFPEPENIALPQSQSQTQHSQDPDFAAFSNEFPALDTSGPDFFTSPKNSSPGYSSMKSPQSTYKSPNNSKSTYKQPEPDSEFIKEWREKQHAVVSERDEAAEVKHLETKEEARKAIDDFYEDYNSKKERNFERNR